MTKVLLVALLFVAALTAVHAKPARDRNQKPWRVVCYLGSWANYRPREGKYIIENIDPHLCTHAIFGFAKLENDRMTVFDPYLDLEENYGLAGYKRFNDLRKRNPELSTIIAIGGWNEGSQKYSDMARDPNRRRVFVNSVLEFLRRYDFDGLDFDWEYPANREGSRPEDKLNFIQVLKELKEAFAPYGYLLTAAVSPGQSTIETAYDIPQVNKYLDFINLMTYDYHGTWDTFTGHNSPLFARPDEKGDQLLLNANYSVNFWLAHGASREKLVMGMAFYARCLKLVDPMKNGMGALVVGAGFPGEFTNSPGMMGYNEICSLLQRERGQWKVTFDEHHRAPYASKGDQWCSYDDSRSIGEKVDYLKSMGLGGAMVWSTDTDDFRGYCLGSPYPLLRTIHRKLSGTEPPTHPPVIDPPSRCQSEGVFGYPNDCTRYYQCIHQSGSFRVVERTCPPGTSFDAIAKQCQHSSQVANCGLVTPVVDPVKPTTAKVTTQKPTPPPTVFVCTVQGSFAYPGDCTKYYRCVQYRDELKAVALPCAPGLVFHPVNKICDYPRNVPQCNV